jgi:hypothetical protein
MIPLTSTSSSCLSSSLSNIINRSLNTNNISSSSINDLHTQQDCSSMYQNANSSTINKSNFKSFKTGTNDPNSPQNLAKMFSFTSTPKSNAENASNFASSIKINPNTNSNKSFVVNNDSNVSMSRGVRMEYPNPNTVQSMYKTSSSRRFELEQNAKKQAIHSYFGELVNGDATQNGTGHVRPIIYSSSVNSTNGNIFNSNLRNQITIKGSFIESRKSNNSQDSVFDNSESKPSPDANGINNKKYVNAIRRLTRESNRLSLTEDPEGYILLNHYKLKNEIGKGSYGIVKLCHNELDDTNYVSF